MNDLIRRQVPGSFSVSALESRIVALPKTLMVDLSMLPGTPDKVEGLVVLDSTTVAIINDNDFDIGTFDENGNNVGPGVKTKIVVIRLSRPLS